MCPMGLFANFLYFEYRNGPIRSFVNMLSVILSFGSSSSSLFLFVVISLYIMFFVVFKNFYNLQQKHLTPCQEISLRKAMNELEKGSSLLSLVGQEDSIRKGRDELPNIYFTLNCFENHKIFFKDFPFCDVSVQSLYHTPTFSVPPTI